jgi:hypothetical protein|tara:strand:+ start:2232 stop:2429 length:198 start_codon:yes stop_codon:yes gene_type:complete
MRTIKIFGLEFIFRIRKNKSLWKFPKRLKKSYRTDLGRIVCYLYDKGTFHNMKGIYDNKGNISVV